MPIYVFESIGIDEGETIGSRADDIAVLLLVEGDDAGGAGAVKKAGDEGEFGSCPCLWSGEGSKRVQEDVVQVGEEEVGDEDLVRGQWNGLRFWYPVVCIHQDPAESQS